MDIFSLLWHLDRRVLYDPACLECLYPREWTYISSETTIFRPTSFETACAAYKKRTLNGYLDDSFAYTSPGVDDVKISNPDCEMKINRFLNGLDMASVDPEEVNGTWVDDTIESSRRQDYDNMSI